MHVGQANTPTSLGGHGEGRQGACRSSFPQQHSNSNERIDHGGFIFISRNAAAWFCRHVAVFFAPRRPSGVIWMNIWMIVSIPVRWNFLDAAVEHKTRRWTFFRQWITDREHLSIGFLQRYTQTYKVSCYNLLYIFLKAIIRFPIWA